MGLSWESQKSITTLRPASPPAALTSDAHAFIAFTDFWNRPGTSGLLTSAMTPTLMVVAVSPMSLPGAVPAGEADGDVAADDETAADGEAAADDEVAGAADEVVLLEELHPAATTTAAAMAAVSPAIRVLLRVLRPVPSRPGFSLIGLTLVPSTTSLPVSLWPGDAREFTTK